MSIAPPTAAAPAPVQTRSERFASVEHADFPEVTGREVDWKFSPVDRLRDLIDGELDGSPYAILSPEVAGATVEWIDRTDARIGTAGTPEDRASANARTTFEKALHIGITGEEPTTITVTRSDLGETARAAHVLVTAEPNSAGLVVLDSRGTGHLAENVEILVGEGAHLTVVTLQEWSDDAIHLASHFARIERDARLKHIVVSLGGGVVRINPSAHLAGAGADVEMLGVYFADAGQHLEQQVFVHHDAPKSKSTCARAASQKTRLVASSCSGS
jgi:Fe-S cluster assembly protein SufD